MKMEDINISMKVDTKQIDEAITKAKELNNLLGNTSIQSRFKSPVLWGSLLTLLLMLLGEWGLYETIGIKQEVIQHTIDFILVCLSGFGIINNPNAKNKL